MVKKFLKDDRGSVTLEFLGMIPYYLLFFLILFQAIISAYSYMSAQSAVNEAAKVYAVTQSESEAQEVAERVTGTGSAVQMTNLSVTERGDGYFDAEVRADHSIVLIPSQWRDSLAISFTHSTSSRVME